MNEPTRGEWIYQYIESVLIAAEGTNEISLRLTRAQVGYLLAAIEVAGHPDND